MESGIMTWTPDEQTPDVVYYHVSISLYRNGPYTRVQTIAVQAGSDGAI